MRKRNFIGGTISPFLYQEFLNLWEKNKGKISKSGLLEELIRRGIYQLKNETDR